MTAFTSLTNRIFFATALLAVLSIGAAIYIVNRAVTRQGARSCSAASTKRRRSSRSTASSRSRPSAGTRA
jgi:hypothetical protein